MTDPEFLTIAEFCKWTRVDRKTVYRRMKARRLAGATKIYGVTRVSIGEIGRMKTWRHVKAGNRHG